MINHMTFDSNGDDQYLTYARDDAAWMDAVFSSRAGSELTDPSYHQAVPYTVEMSSRGAAPVVVFDFEASLEQPSYRGEAVVFIKKMRGYISGRYFEVTNERANTIDAKKGVGVVKIKAFAFPDSNPITFSQDTNAGQAYGFKAINEIPREPKFRLGNHNIYAQVLVYFNPNDPERKLYITEQNSQTKTPNQNIFDPYGFTLKTGGFFAVPNPDVLPGAIITEKNSMVYQKYENGDGRSVYDKDFGALSAVVHKIPKPNVVNTQNEGVTFYPGYFGYRLGSTPGDFGAYSGVMLAANEEPAGLENKTIAEALADWSKWHTSTYGNPHFDDEAGETHDVTPYLYRRFLNIIAAGVVGFNQKDQFLAGNAQIKGIPKNGGHELSWRPDPLTLGDVRVQIHDVSYITNRELGNIGNNCIYLQSSDEPTPTFGGNDKNFAKLTVTASIPSITLRGYKDKDRDQSLDFSLDPVELYQKTVVVPLVGLQFKENGDFDPRYFDSPYQYFKQHITRTKYDESEFFRKLMTPVMGVFCTAQALVIQNNKINAKVVSLGYQLWEDKGRMVTAWTDTGITQKMKPYS